MMNYKTTRVIYGRRGNIAAGELVSIDLLRQMMTAGQLAELETSGAIVPDHQGGSFGVLGSILGDPLAELDTAQAAEQIAAQVVSTHGMSTNAVRRVIAKLSDVGQLRTLYASEQANPEHPGGRASVLERIDRRCAQLEQGDAG